MIRVENIHKRLGTRPVLRGVSLEIQQGEILALVGPSGAGKTVLLKHIIGLIPPDAGDVRVDGLPVARATYRELERLRRRMGYVFQDAALLDSLSVRENLCLALDDELCARDDLYCPRRIADALATVNLDASILDKRPNELSGGMKKRVGVARAVIHAPDVILYDEPTTGLDPQNVAQINEVIVRARDHLGATSVVVTHDLPSVRRIADRVVLLADGHPAFEGTADEFFASRDPVVVDFRGDTAPLALIEPHEVMKWRITHAAATR